MVQLVDLSLLLLAPLALARTVVHAVTLSSARKPTKPVLVQLVSRKSQLKDIQIKLPIAENLCSDVCHFKVETCVNFKCLLPYHASLHHARMEVPVPSFRLAPVQLDSLVTCVRTQLLSQQPQ